MSLRQQAYEAIKHKIVTLQLAPGSVIDESFLREELNLGRTPIREALQRLQYDKLVNIVPRRGMFVTEVSINDLPMLYESRVVLEAHIAEVAARRGSAEHWDEMDNLLTIDLNTTSQDELMMVDKRCHEIMFEAASNHFITDTLIMLYAQSHRLWYQYLSRVSHMTQAIQEHKLICNALRAGDGDLASELVEKHVRAFQAEIQAVMMDELLFKG